MSDYSEALSGCAGAGRAKAGAEDGVGARMVMACGTWWGLFTLPHPCFLV